MTSRPEQLAHALAQIEDRLAGIVAGSDPIVLRYLADFAHQPGKRLRPRLLVSMAQLCGGAAAGALANCGACCELLHSATLIHDDVIDSSTTRRGIPTVNSRYGNEIAVVVGDYLFASLLQSLTLEQDFQLLRMLLETGQLMGLGVIEEVLNRGNLQLSEEQYYSTIRLKTAVLFSLCCKMGAALAGADEARIELAAEYGIEIGLAFQIADDLLDLTRSDEQIGKPALSDLREGRITLPLIHAVGEQPGQVRQLVEDYQTTHDPQIGAALRSALYATGSVEYAALCARGHLLTARDAGARLTAEASGSDWGIELEQLEQQVFASLPRETAAVV